MLEWSFEVGRKWLECGAAQHLSSFHCTNFKNLEEEEEQDDVNRNIS